MTNKYWDAMVKNKNVNHAVSEVLGVVLLLGITISLFAFLNFFVNSFSFHQSGPIVSLTGDIDKVNSVINIKNNGGDSLEGTTKIVITIGTTTYQRNISEILNHVDNWKLFVSNSDKNPELWDFSETVQFSFKGVDITGEYIQATVVDPIINTLLLSIVLQQGVTE